ncbi:hypothetical protein EG329_002760 [Mollisiaceae sp. DMI_Dod_QoI]|nr:hypothetical protein EG329_002760 [Helotiales sp. DMI_Dod_QoI]
MDITESEFSISLQEAFTCYLAFLSHAQRLREIRLPRQGKGVETTADISTQRHHQVRVVASETCLRYTGRIAKSVRRWNNNPEEPGNDDSANVEVDMEHLYSFLEALPEDPFVDPFSGKLVQPTSASSSGPSPKDEATPKEVQEPTGSRVQRPALERQQPYRKIAHEYLERKARSRGTRPSLGLHPNAPISPLSPLPTTRRRSSSVISSRTSLNSLPTPDSSISDHENETDQSSVTSEMATAYYLQYKSDAGDMEYAKKIEAEEKRRKEQVERSYAEARRLADRMARQEKARLQQQERYARDLERKEWERAERIRLDREAAEKSQARWLMETTAREAEAKKRLEDRKRREHDEGKRIADNEKKVRFGRERSSNERIKRRSPSVSDEKRRREAQTVAEDHRRHKEVEKKDKVSKPKKVDCVSCMEPGNKKEMAILPCNHAYCGECITGAFKTAYKSRTPFKCCGRTVPTANLSQQLTTPFVQKYDLLLLELSTKKPTYCSSPTCSKFIPPSSIHGPIAICPTCRIRTCVACNKKEHSGVCKEDKDGKKVEELAKKKGWKQCPKCSQILERTEGCLHMTCRCRAEWCYACLRDWDVCRSTCGRSATGGGNLGMDPVGAGVRGFLGDDALRDNADVLRRIERTAVRPERPGLGILPAVAIGLMMAMFED